MNVLPEYFKEVDSRCDQWLEEIDGSIGYFDTEPKNSDPEFLDAGVKVRS